MRSTLHAESPFFSRDMSFLVLPVYCPTKLRGGRQCVQRLLVLRRKWTAFQILRSEEHTSELQSQSNLVCRLLLEKKKEKIKNKKTSDKQPITTVSKERDDLHAMQ